MRPKIAVILDENTSKGGDRYEATHDYIHAIVNNGGDPYGIFYTPHMQHNVVKEFDGILNIGGGIAFPEDWLADGYQNPYNTSARMDVEIAIMQDFLNADKPVFGICHGMQALAGLYGCKIHGDIKQEEHWRKDHAVTLTPKSHLAAITRTTELAVNSYHRQGITDTAHPNAQIAAHAHYGIIEGIEIKNKKFALGVLWHQEKFWHTDHPGNRIFDAFIKACA